MTILTLLTTMNIMPNQIPLTADNYKENIKRRWRSSTLDCFNSNLVAVFYRYVLVNSLIIIFNL